MLQKVDLGDNRNLFTASVILIFGIGGFCLKIGDVKLLTPACSLIMGILVHLLVSLKKDKPAEEPEKVEEKTEKTE